MVVHHSIPGEDDPLVQAKLRFYEKHHGEFDALFIGSSRIYCQVSPKIFDATFAARGIEVSSFNLGFPAVAPPETFYLLRKILKLSAQRPKWVIIELANFRTEIPLDLHNTHRERAWHDWRETWLEAEYIWKLESRTNGLVRMSRFIQAFSPHLQSFASNIGNLSRGHNLLFSHPPKKRAAGGGKRSKPKRAKGESLQSSRGFKALDEKALTQSQVNYLAKGIHRLAQTPVKRSGSDSVLREAINRAEDECARLGVTVIFVIPPTLATVNKHVLTEDRSRAHVLFAYDDPVKYPKLYAPTNRRDTEHLNQAGAEEFSRVLADDFARWLVDSERER